VRSDLLDQFKRSQAEQTPPAPPNFAFEEQTLFESHRGPLRFIRRLLNPVLKLFFNPNPLIQALHIQSQLNTINAERESARRGLDQLQYEVMHNLVVELTRMSIQVKNIKMRVESLASRLEFNERRARALESAVVYRETEQWAPATSRPSAPPSTAMGEAGPVRSGAPGTPGPDAGEGPGQRSRRRRRRRGRRNGASATTILSSGPANPATVEGGTAPEGSAHDAFDDPPSSPSSGPIEAPESSERFDSDDRGNDDDSGGGDSEQ
jgi:hypothetical protein